MTSFIIKIIALITMTIDHTGVIFQDVLYLNGKENLYTFLRLIGRISFVLYAFLIAEGCLHTKNKIKYVSRLFGFAILIHLGYIFGGLLFQNGEENVLSSFDILNIFFTLTIGALTCFGYDYLEKTELKKFKFMPILLAMPVAYFMKVDYSYAGVLLIFTFYASKNCEVLLKYILIVLVVLLNYVGFLTKDLFFAFVTGESFNFLMPFFALISVVIIYFYNEKIGHSRGKWFFYFAYPAHLIIIYLIKLALFG